MMKSFATSPFPLSLLSFGIILAGTVNHRHQQHHRAVKSTRNSLVLLCTCWKVPLSTLCACLKNAGTRIQVYDFHSIQPATGRFFVRGVVLVVVVVGGKGKGQTFMRREFFIHRSFVHSFFVYEYFIVCVSQESRPERKDGRGSFRRWRQRKSFFGSFCSRTK